MLSTTPRYLPTLSLETTRDLLTGQPGIPLKMGAPIPEDCLPGKLNVVALPEGRYCIVRIYVERKYASGPTNKRQHYALLNTRMAFDIKPASVNYAGEYRFTCKPIERKSDKFSLKEAFDNLGRAGTVQLDIIDSWERDKTLFNNQYPAFKNLPVHKNVPEKRIVTAAEPGQD